MKNYENINPETTIENKNVETKSYSVNEDQEFIVHIAQSERTGEYYAWSINFTGGSYGIPVTFGQGWSNDKEDAAYKSINHALEQQK